MTDQELLNEILSCLRVNMLRGMIITEDDDQFMHWLDLWSEGKSARSDVATNEK